MASILISSGHPSLPQNPIEFNDGDGLARSKWLEKEWLLLDGMGTVRNSAAAAAAFLGSSVPAPVVGAIPIMQVVGGLLIMHSAITETVPKSYQKWTEAIKNKEPEGHQEGVISTGLGFANQALYLAIGAELTAAGTTAFLSPEAAHVFGYSPVMGSAATEAIANLAVGATCVVRGLVMAGRSLYNLSYINPFHNELRNQLLTGQKTDAQKINDTKVFLARELGKGKERFIRRVGKEAADQVNNALQNPAAANWRSVIEQVDRGVFKQKLMQYLTLVIGILMILGGIAAMIFGGGLTSTIVLAVSCVLFANMEFFWFFYDSTPLFNSIVDKLYTKPDFWKEPAEESIPEAEPASA